MLVVSDEIEVVIAAAPGVVTHNDLQQLLNEGKPEAMLERIIPGKVKAILKEVCLVDQKFVKNGDMTVAQYVDSVAKEIGKTMKVVEMVRYEVGEGIEKKEENFAEEVAKQMGQ